MQEHNIMLNETMERGTCNSARHRDASCRDLACSAQGVQADCVGHPALRYISQLAELPVGDAVGDADRAILIQRIVRFQAEAHERAREALGIARDALVRADAQTPL